MFIAWMRRLLLNLKPIGTWSDWTPGWAIGGWFIPILNFFRPKQIMDDIWRGSDPDLALDDGHAWRRATVSPLLHWWWAFWIGGGLGGIVVATYMQGDIESRGEAGSAVALRLALFVSTILAFWVVTRLTAHQEARAHRMAVAAGTVTPAPDEAEPTGRPWWQVAALPVAGAVVIVVGSFVFDLPSPLEKVEASGQAGYGTWDASEHGFTVLVPDQWDVIDLDEATKRQMVAAMGQAGTSPELFDDIPMLAATSQGGDDGLFVVRLPWLINDEGNDPLQDLMGMDDDDLREYEEATAQPGINVTATLVETSQGHPALVLDMDAGALGMQVGMCVIATADSQQFMMTWVDSPPYIDQLGETILGSFTLAP